MNKNMNVIAAPHIQLVADHEKRLDHSQDCCFIRTSVKIRAISLECHETQFELPFEEYRNIKWHIENDGLYYPTADCPDPECDEGYYDLYDDERSWVEKCRTCSGAGRVGLMMEPLEQPLDEQLEACYCGLSGELCAHCLRTLTTWERLLHFRDYVQGVTSASYWPLGGLWELFANAFPTEVTYLGNGHIKHRVIGEINFYAVAPILALQPLQVWEIFEPDGVYDNKKEALRRLNEFIGKHHEQAAEFENKMAKRAP